MKNHSKGTLLVNLKKKAMPVTAFAFFLGLTSAFGQTSNLATGDSYDIPGVAFSTEIISIADGEGTLDVRYDQTTRIELLNQISGFINISNNFSSFTIDSTDPASSLTGHSLIPALSVIGGTNLSIIGGNYTGGTITTNSSDSMNASAAYLSGVQNASIVGAAFTGGSISITNSSSGVTPGPDGTNLITQSSSSIGANGLILHGSTNITFSDSTTAITGGSGGTATSNVEDSSASGGHGLVLLNSTSVISNGTFRGGAGGSAMTTAAALSATADGGTGLFATNSMVTVTGGKFTGGAAGTATGSSTSTKGGAGFTAIGGSDITVDAGTFTGASGAAGMIIQNSALTFNAGTVSGGLLGETIGGGTNTIAINGGTISKITLNNTTNGFQKLTVDGLTQNAQILQNRGSVLIDNISNQGLNNITVTGGSMEFMKDLVINSEGSFTLANKNSSAQFQALDLSGTLDVGLGQVDTTGLLTVRNGGQLDFQILSPTDFGSISANSASFETGSALNVDASLAGFSAGSESNTILTTTGLSIDTNDVTIAVLTSENTNIVGRTSATLAVAGNDLTVIFNTASLSNYWGATGTLAVFADELDTINDQQMNLIINGLGATASKAAVEETYFTKLNTMQTSLQGLNAALGLSLSRGTEFRETLDLPKAANGPDEIENDWRFWAKYYGQLYTHKENDETEAYDANLHGGAIGMDKSFGPLLIGFSGGMGNYTIESDNDSSEDIDAAHGTLYATLGWGHSFIDLSAAYGFNNVESQSDGPFMLEGDYDTQLISGYIGGGIGFELESIGTVITPEVSAQFTSYTQDAYTETSSVGAVPRSFDEFDADSLRTSIGLNAAMLNKQLTKTFNYKIEGRFHWLREMNPDPGDLNFQLVGGANDYLIAYPALDEDIYRVGIGFTFFNADRKGPENMLLRLDFDELFGEDFNSHNLSAKVVYAF